MKSTKKTLWLLLLLPLFLTGCNRDVETIKFEGVIRGYFDCTNTSSIFEIEFGYIVALDTPDSLGADYTDGLGKTYHNCVVLYRTKAHFADSDTIRGELYLDEDYSRAYCTFHYDHSLPEAVCYALER
ncbi:MAG: hypothetical protein MJZ77_07825 [Bacteroidales bacterium]|nr:hypothetical protein [Bacteroidales bacterium]